MAREIPVQLSTDTHDFEKYSRGATKHTRVTRTRACMATSHMRVWHAKFPLQLSTDMHDFEKYSRGATKHTRVTRTRASSLN